MIQTIKLEYGFDSEGKKLKMASKMAVSWHPRWPSVSFKELSDHKNKLDIKHFNLDFIWMFVGLILQLIK